MSTADPEEWRPVPQYAAFYEVSTRGSVYSLPRAKTAGGLLKPQLNSAGYRVIRLSKYGVVRTVTVASLVLAAFTGPPPRPGMRARHRQGKTDDSLRNLFWGLFTILCHRLPFFTAVVSALV